MASDRKYAYYFRGRDIALVEYKNGKWQSPTGDVAHGLMFEYSKLPSTPANEGASLDMSEAMANALIYYLKAMKAEEANELREREHFYQLFLKWAHMDRDNKVKAVRRVTPLFSSSAQIRTSS